MKQKQLDYGAAAFITCHMFLEKTDLKSNGDIFTAQAPLCPPTIKKKKGGSGILKSQRSWKSHKKQMSNCMWA